MSQSKRPPKIILANLNSLLKQYDLRHNLPATKNCLKENQQGYLGNPCKLIVPTAAFMDSQLYESLEFEKEEQEIDTRNEDFNRIDAIYTQLEDYFCYAKEGYYRKIKAIGKSTQVSEEQKIVDMRIKVDEMADMVGHVKNIERGFCTENSLECMKTRGGLIEQKRDHYNRLFMTNNVKPKYKQCPKS